MKFRKYSGAMTFLAAATVTALTLYPAVTRAVGPWRQYSASGCVLQGPPLPAFANGLPRMEFFQGAVVNRVLAPTSTGPFPDERHIRVECPILEDQLDYAKGGSTVSVTFDQGTSSWQSSFLACVAFDNASGGTCGSEKLTATNSGVVTVSTTPPASVWTSANHYAYLYTKIGARTTDAAAFSSLKGYYTRAP